MKASCSIYTDYARNVISNNLFGHFTEHCEDVLYDGVFDLHNALADEDGLREDVCAALKAANVATLRYPGGNFVSNYHWEDGIGPREQRPRVFDYAWLAEDDNRMGTVEFIKLCKKVNAEPYLCVNMGSGTAEEAMHWVEFCNGTGNTKYANMRRALGYDAPFGVKYWGLGNEMYGDWQFGSCSALDYAKKAKDFAKAMKWVDPSIKLVAAGYDLDSDWNRTVANQLKNLIDHIAIHHYSIGFGVFDEKDYHQCMYLPEYLEKLTKACYASIVSGTNDPLTKIKVAWDEWNTYAWHQENGDDEATYNLRNSLLTAMILHSFIRNSDMVEIASYSPFVNECGAIRTTKDGMLKRSQYYVFEMLSKAFGACKQYVPSHTKCDMLDLPEVIDFSNRLPEPKFALDEKPLRRTVQTPYVDIVAAKNADETMVVVSAINKHECEDCELDLRIFGHAADFDQLQATILYADDMHAANSFEKPDTLVTKPYENAVCDGKIILKAHSLTNLYIPIQQ